MRQSSVIGKTSLLLSSSEYSMLFCTTR